MSSNNGPDPAPDAGRAAGWWARHGLDLAPLRMSAFRLLYLARLVGVLTYGVLAVSVAWQVWSLTQSSLHVAGVGVGLAIGTLAGLLWGGVLADRADRRRVMVMSRAAYVLVIVILLANSLRETPGVSWIYAATVLSGLTGGISAPSLMSTLPRLVPLALLPAAGALNALLEQGGRLVGPLIAGAVIAAWGLAYSFSVVLVGAILIPVLLSRLPSLPAAPDAAGASAGKASASRRRPASIQGWIDGARFALKSPVVGGLLILDVLMALLATPWVLLPQWSEQVLGGDARLLGMLHAAPAVGAVLAAALSGWTRRLRRPGGVVVLAALCWGVLMAGLGSVSSVFLALAVLALAGAVDTISDIIRGALLQQHTPDHLRGRVSALWLLEVNLAPAAGGMLIGGVAQRLGPALALLAGGACCALGSLALAGCQKGLRASQWSDRALTP
ncbi:MAG: MFS transporter [Pigmentiphaga sp.]|nr:MFS transporter [Pigmentiphaga sp.]